MKILLFPIPVDFHFAPNFFFFFCLFFSVFWVGREGWLVRDKSGRNGTKIGSGAVSDEDVPVGG